ncbi:hypothetical protein LBMAG42_03830 [Deltaproteobacteria bacterium]|nr:hypothetical protein LBMAG42_03830 [Deltaproteobacteria bacterium]
MVGVGIGVTVVALAAGAALEPGAELETAARTLPWLVGLGAALILAPAAAALGRFSGVAALAALLGWLAATTLPLGLGAVLAALGAVIGARAEPPLANLGLRRLGISPIATCVAGLAGLACAASFLALRPSLGPVPESAIHLVSWAFVAGAMPASRRLAAVALVVALLGAASALRGDPWVAPGVLFPLLGAAPVLVARALGVTITGLFIPAVAVALAVPVVRSLPAAWQTVGARADEGLPPESLLRDRIGALRTGAAIRTSWGWWGSSQVWGGSSASLVELDGSVAGSSGRARSAERLAGTLAACASSGRGRARVTGDDFGRVVVSLREQGFSGIDVALPDSGLADALASVDEGARRAWLSTEVRLLALPPRSLLGARGAADVVVEIVRNGWRDGRSAWPSAAHVRAAASHVGEGGAHVLVLPGRGIDDGALGGAIRHFGDAWPVVGVFVPPQGAEELLLVGAARPIPWVGIEHCVAAAPWLRSEGVTSAVELASLAVADHHFARAVEAGREPGHGMPEAPSLLPIASLLAENAESEHLFGGSVPEELGSRQATRRASLSVLLAGASGDVRAALERARELADQPGAGAAIDPMIAPMLDRARSSATAARAEGVDSAKWAEADAAIEAALLLNPASATARCLRGDIAMARRRVDEAARWYGECAERDEASAAPWEGLAHARMIQGDRVGAEEAFRAAARLAPNSWQAALRLGVFLRGIGEAKEAETWLKRAVEGASTSRDVGRSWPHLALAMLYLESARPELALAEARRAEVDEGSADSAYWVAAAQYELKLWEESESGFRLALKRREGFVEAQNGLGLCLARRHDYEGAAAAFRAVLSRDPKNAMAREKLDLLRDALGERVDGERGKAPPTP